MDVQDYLDKMKKIQNNILYFLNDENNIEENFQNIINSCDAHNIHDDEYSLKSILHLIMNITNNHYHMHDFFNKIERILIFFKNDIKSKFQNWEIFNIFKSNKRIILFLLEEKIMVIDEYLINAITKESKTNKYLKSNYLQYFSPEIHAFIKEKSSIKCGQIYLIPNELIKEIQKDLPENFYINRKTGENNSLICKLIREDDIDDFIKFFNKNGISVKAIIEPSIYETNLFLIKQQLEFENHLKFGSINNTYGVSLINYAAFFGSIKIFNFLRSNGAELNSSIWAYAMHGKNYEIISYLEDNNVELENKSYKKCFIESVKCHHNDLANYIYHNYLFTNIFEPKNIEIFKDLQLKNIKFYNFFFIEKEFIDESIFSNLCKYDHCQIVEFLLKSRSFDVNKKIINYYFNNGVSSFK